MVMALSGRPGRSGSLMARLSLLRIFRMIYTSAQTGSSSAYPQEAEGHRLKQSTFILVMFTAAAGWRTSEIVGVTAVRRLFALHSF